MKKIDLSKYNIESKSVLSPLQIKSTSDNITKDVVTKSKGNNKNTGGRPKICDEVLEKKVTVNFSVSEHEKIKKKAGNSASISLFIRNIIKDNLGL